MTFSPHSTLVTERERSVSLAQWNIRARGFPHPAEWWRPENGLRLAARALRHAADTALGAEGRSLEGAYEWHWVRQVYAKGHAGARSAFGPRPTLDAMRASRTGASLEAHTGAVLARPLLDRLWGAMRKPVDETGWDSWPGLVRTPNLSRESWGGLPTVATHDFIERAESVLPVLRFVTRQGETMNVRELASWPEVVPRTRVLLIKLAIWNYWYGTGSTSLTWTSTYRTMETVLAKRPDTKVSQHNSRTAVDLLFDADSRNRIAVPCLARLFAGFARGPDFDELGGMGVYSAPRAAGMIHVDSRPRRSGAIAKWSEGYPHPVF